MAGRTLEARAIISAKDQASAVFAQVGRAAAKMGAATKAASGIAGKNVNAVTAPLGKLDKVVHRVSGAVAATYAAHRGARVVENVAELYKTFDDLARYQRAILGITEAQQAPLLKQATSGEIKGFNDIEILHAQLDLAQRGLQQDAIIPITKAAASFALALGTDLPTAAKTLEGILFSTGKDLHDTGAAVEAANKAASYATKLAKIGGLDEEDVRQFFKYAGAPGSVAGFSDATMGAVAAILRKSNIRGDEAGVAMRAFAGKLVAPTKKGMAALDALGIDYASYTKMPGALSADNLGAAVKRQLGRSLSEAQMAALRAAMEDPDVVGDQGAFTDKAVEIVGAGFAKNKKGQLAAKDAQAIAKVASTFYRLAVESVDVEGLLRTIIEKNPTLAQSNALFTERQGARFSVLAKGGLPLFNEYVQKLLGAGDNFHLKIAEERSAGFAGAMKQAEAATLNFTTALGRAWDPELTGAMRTFATTVQHLSELDPTVLKLGTAVGGTVAALIAFEAAAKAGAIVMGLANAASAGAGAGAAVGGVAAAGAAGAGAGAAAGGLGVLGAAGVGLAAAGVGYLGYKGAEALAETEWMKHLTDALNYWNSARPTFDGPLAGGGAPLGPGLRPLDGNNVKAEVSGRADVNVTVKVEPSDWLQATVKEAKGAMKIQNGAPTGRSMPEAEPPSSGASGQW
ncbi:phage tail tape measure protein [Xanthobacter dioxanivorans]|uniref:Phage tail tape measure protein n=1 Tax=Xanthobacter dioxanivorans TaxID=2528964 RepID=A0A974PMI6_9HYPH|nr:phage tail tape measure protein [Xanthobacter dioxanivorans]QRG05926.1 phage tail tape measure protein [Xanthobacter dioxanivorans]